MLLWYSLTRRFSVLRNSSGEPIGLDEIKSKLAEQRARGAENRVSEEEEDMILEALSRLRTKGPNSRPDVTDPQDERMMGGYGDGGSRLSESPSFAGGQSVRSTTSTSSGLHGSPSIASMSSTKGSQVGRRMSNNLFGSGKFQDHTYMRTAYQQRTTTSTSSRAPSIKHSDSSMSTITSSRVGPHNSVYSDMQSLRPVTPDGSSTYGSSAPSSPNRPTHGQESDMDTDTKPDLSRTLVPEVLGRASLALDEVIRELEEEGDDEILMERSPISTTPLVSPATVLQPISDPSPLTSSPPTSPADTDSGVAVSSDDGSQRGSSFPRPSTASPTPRLPGYIPGMPRPMTPHNLSFDSDDPTPSSTPRATSPRLPASHYQPPPRLQSLVSGLNRSTSSASVARTPGPVSPPTSIPVSTSPLFFHRSTNGRFTPEDRSRNGSGADSTPRMDEAPDSPTTGLRRPISPLSGHVFQTMTNVSGSRPPTPSSITWTPPATSNGTKGHAKSSSMSGQSASGHSRNGSTASTADESGDMEHSKLNTRSLRSPTNPESSWQDSRHASSTSLATNADNRPPSTLSGTNLISSPSEALNRPLRSPTPTHNATYSPTPASFADQGAHVNGNGNGFSPGRRALKQNANSSFSFTTSQALLFSPLSNMSRSSLESAGSSYHSWDEEHKKDRLFDLFSSLDPQPQWHDLSVERSTSSTSRTTPYDAPDSEDLVRRQLGLNKSDIATIQEKLVAAALTKAATPEGRHRANSVRRRRPSTSQSNYSFTGADKASAPSQAAQPQGPSTTSTTSYTNRQVNSEQLAKANALLDSVVDSIQSPRKQPLSLVDVEEPVVATNHVVEPVTNPSPSQRHRALADALFGTEDRQKVDATLPSAFIFPATTPASPPGEPEISASEECPSDHVVDDDQVPTEREERVAVTLNDPPLIASEPNGHLDSTLLALEVQRRAEAATAALRKSPSNPKLSDAFGSSRKRIDREQISRPTLVSASTSVDTIPLTAVNPPLSRMSNAPPTGLGARIKRLRGTLRAKPPQAPGMEISRPSADLAKTPPAVQTITFNPSPKDNYTKEHLIPSSANESERYKTSPPLVASPPASAGPGLKGFMSRFRKHKPTEFSTPSDPFSLPATLSPASTPTQHYSVHGSTRSDSLPDSRSAPASRTVFSGSRPLTPSDITSPSLSSSQTIVEDTPVPAPIAPAQSGEAALKQLFDAAHDLGLDQIALNELLARSPSAASNTTARARAGRSNSAAGTRQTQHTELRETMPSPLPFDVRPSVEAISSGPSPEIRHLTIRKNATSTMLPPAPAQKDPSTAVVRRTIIIPSDSKATMDLNALLRRQSTSRKRQSVGAASMSSARSIQDRVPTPPPPRSNASKRFSAGRSPPVPTLPSFSARDESPGAIEKSNSTYESLYEMYAGDSRTPSTAFADGGASSSQATQGEAAGEGGPAVEVVELANGETIWSIVNGLRDDDTDSFYDNRASFTSEYSAEGVRVFFKEHGRKTSKSSNTSLLSRKKQQGSASQRPETKVFFSSSAQIDRLIDTLTRDKEAGSFNISPERQYSHLGHSASSSTGSATDMLERMLGSMSADTS
ncbi:hypothetical protein BC835DRAFT_1417305 [Cytidiella melzeri]|nr:hypothetical protein BC835DRAFT_1417305 [Cytidiella melzeri]